MVRKRAPTILIVDDDINMVRAIEVLLRKEGYSTISAGSGEDVSIILGLENTNGKPKSTRGNDIDLVILDITMPRINSYEVCKRIKSDEQLKYIPVIMLTAKSSVENMVEGLESPADDYIPKPFRSEELIARIKAMLRIKEMEQELLHRNKELEKLYRFGIMLNAEQDIDKLLSLVISQAVELSETAAGILMLLDNHKQGLEVRASLGLEVEEEKLIREEEYKYLLEESEPLLINNLRGDNIAGVEKAIFVPLVSKNKTIGIMMVFNRKGEEVDFSPRIFRLLATFANQAAIAIENAMLYRKQLESAKEFQEVLKRLEEKNRELESFSYSVSHDLKVPLVSIGGFAALLLRRFSGTLDDRGKLYLQRINEDAKRMGGLIQSLLELSRAGRVLSEFEDIDVKDMLDLIYSELEPQLKEKDIKLYIQKDIPMIRGEREGLFRVFINLIDNAIKYIGSGEDKRIEIRCDDLGEQWRFCVCDNGIGVPDNYQETIFAVFERVPEMDREGLEGTGVGLSIVKKIIEAHNGRIWVESEEGKGSFFYFTIPKNIC